MKVQISPKRRQTRRENRLPQTPIPPTGFQKRKAKEDELENRNLNVSFFPAILA